MRHQSQIVLGNFVEIQQQQKGYLIYIPSTRKIFSSHDVVFNETFYIVLAYASRNYSEVIAMRP